MRQSLRIGIDKILIHYYCDARAPGDTDTPNTSTTADKQIAVPPLWAGHRHFRLRHYHAVIAADITAALLRLIPSLFRRL